MTTSSSRQQNPTKAAKVTSTEAAQRCTSSNAMECEDTTAPTTTTCHDSNQGMKKTKQVPQKMPQDQRQHPAKRNRVRTSNRPKGTDSRSTISKRNRRRKQQFTDPDQLESEIRQAYFSAASWVAIRYSVSVEDLIEHLRAGGLHYASRPMTASQYVEDIVLCVAICLGREQAWNDLRQVFDLTLTRACTLTMSEQDSVVFVQKFLSDLAKDTEQHGDSQRRRRSARVGTTNGTGSDQTTEEDAGLRDYIGLVPLRIWLTNKILARLEDMPLPESITATDNGGTPRPSLQLVD